MQTFLPYSDFAESARALDDKRLGSQRNEALVILKALMGLYKNGAWANHPAVKQWRGHELALLTYLVHVCREWRRRGHLDTVEAQALEIGGTSGESGDPPRWIGDERFHRSHKSNLLRKNPEHYAGLPGFEVPNDLPYFWPSKEGY